MWAQSVKLNKQIHQIKGVLNLKSGTDANLTPALLAPGVKFIMFTSPALSHAVCSGSKQAMH